MLKLKFAISVAFTMMIIFSKIKIFFLSFLKSQIIIIKMKSKIKRQIELLRLKKNLSHSILHIGFAYWHVDLHE